MECVKQEYAAKLLKWVSELTEQHKKGLRVIKTVLDIKGAKRFKKRNTICAETAADNIDYEFKDSTDAKIAFRKMVNTTSYCKTFGDKPKAQEDF